ncbi:MAG: glycoside hydrolase family 172 protein [Planctomycetota bacterium]|jgi:hypothetical protein
MSFNGLGMNMGNLSLQSSAKTRSISPENVYGEKGKGGMAEPSDTPQPEVEQIGQVWNNSGCADKLGQGWKVRPWIILPGQTITTLMDIDGPGAIQQIWLTIGKGVQLRHLILRMYWDGEEKPSVECPLGDFFCTGWGEFAQLTSLPVCVNPGSGYNSYWEMPFRKKARITLENLSEENTKIYYQINYALTDVPEDAAYFHAQFRRVNPLPYKDVYTILDGAEGHGHYVGTYMAWGVNNTGWWGEGEIKFYLDGDKEFPTICGTGTEDYFCGSYGFVNQETQDYEEYTTPYAGMHQVIRPDGLYKSQQRFGLYRWHITDPVRFEKDLRVTIQALGWRGKHFLPLQDDISSVAFWYQAEPHKNFPELPDRDYLEVI